MAVDKILVIGPSWVGDMVMAHSLFQTLKQQNPSCQIDVAAPAWTLPLLDRMPEVSGKIALPFKHGKLNLFERIRLGRGLKDDGYQQSINLVNSLKSAILPFAAGIPRRTGFLGEMRYGLLNDIRPLDKQLLPKTVDRFVALGLPSNSKISSIPQPKLTANSNNGEAFIQALTKSTHQAKRLGLCPGAEFGEAKRWPVEHYAEVANAALKQGWEVFLFGSDKDKNITDQINQLTKSSCLNLSGKTSLGEAVDVMSCCDTVISNDSGLMHVAAALDKKLIAIYGSSDPNHTPPIHPDAIIKWLALDCSPCFARTCKLGHLNCLNNIQPQAVIQYL